MAEKAEASSTSAFNIHAGVLIHKGDREGLERLCRYGTQPPFSLERRRAPARRPRRLPPEEATQERRDPPRHDPRPVPGANRDLDSTPTLPAPALRGRARPALLVASRGRRDAAPHEAPAARRAAPATAPEEEAEEEEGPRGRPRLPVPRPLCERTREYARAAGPGPREHQPRRRTPHAVVRPHGLGCVNDRHDPSAPWTWLLCTVGLSVLTQQRERQRLPIDEKKMAKASPHIELCAAVREPSGGGWTAFRDAWQAGTLPTFGADHWFHLSSAPRGDVGLIVA